MPFVPVCETITNHRRREPKCSTPGGKVYPKSLIKAQGDKQTEEKAGGEAAVQKTSETSYTRN